VACQTCPSPVPVVSLRLAKYLVKGIRPDQRHEVLRRALAWLVEQHPGLKSYMGVAGRPYQPDERKAIVAEVAVVGKLACPFLAGETCLLDGLPAYTPASESLKPPYLWLPTAMAKLLGETTLREMVKRRFVADAKVTMMTRNEGL
jgi:hypothetical protein